MAPTDIEKAAKARNDALQGALTQIEREFGKGTIMRMGDEGAQVKVNAIPTGALSLGQDDARLPRPRRDPEARRHLRVHRRRACDGPALRP
jgi:hypothetical protein